MLKITKGLIWSLALLGSVSAQAETTPKDVQVAARSFSFLIPKPPTPTAIAVVFDPASPATEADAKRILESLAGISGTTARAISLADIGTASDVQVIFVAFGLGDKLPEILTATGGRKILTISSDPACVATGSCVMGVVTAPKVLITINKAAALGVGVSFDSAFLMMVTER